MVLQIKINANMHLQNNVYRFIIYTAFNMLIYTICQKKKDYWLIIKSKKKNKKKLNFILNTIFGETNVDKSSLYINDFGYKNEVDETKYYEFYLEGFWL